jgi:ATP/maltotriose-dependent transcriptional regulator MalT
MDACDRTRDWDRAREWFEHVTRLAMRWNNHLFHAQCRPHYAVVLTWRGAWQEAESELQLAIDEMSAVRKPMATEGIVRLAELRWRQGRWEEAATLFEQVKHEPLAQLGLGTLCLDQGDSAQALVLAERCLRRLPGGDRLERLPALDLYIRACLALGDCDRAREAVPELEEIAGAVATRPVRATAHLALGLIAAASGDTERARYEIEDAVDLFEAAQAPFEASRARYELARVLRALGLPADAARQGRIALETLTALGARQEAERAAQLISLAASEPAPIDSIAELSRRETEVLGLLAAGLSNQEIAERLVLSIRTVQRHIENIYTKTGARGRAAAAVFAITHGLVPPGP